MLAVPPRGWPSVWLRYGLAVGSSGLALASALLLEPLIGQTVFPLFLAAVMLSAWYGGLGPGLLAIGVSAASSLYALLPARLTLEATVELLVRLAVFLGAAFLISALTEARRRSEAVAQIERERYAVTLRSIGDGVIVTDRAGQVTALNPVAEALTGWSDAEARGRPVDEVFRIINEATRRPVESPVARCLREGRVVGLANHTLLITRDGRERPIDDSGAPVVAASGAVIGAVLVFRDITERYAEERRREAALRSEQQARAAAEAAESRAAFLAQASALLASSLASEETLQAIARLAVSAIADLCVVFLREPDGMIRRVASVHIDPARELKLQALQATLIDPASNHPAAVVIRTGAPLLDPVVDESVMMAAASDPAVAATLRELLPTSHLVVPLVARDTIIGAFSLGMQGSGRQYGQADIALAQGLAQRAALAVDNARLYEAAQAAVLVRDRFLALAAHELRTPLTAALGNVQLLARRLAQLGLDDERALRKTTLVEAQLRRLADLIALLLDVSHLEAGQLSIQRAPCDLCALARRVIELAEGTTDQHTLRCETPAEPVVVLGDLVRLEQVVDNLLQNAVKYSPNGGTITLRVGRRQAHALLAVVDQGVGIPAEALPRVYERFYRVPHPELSAVSGMGIGLYVVREIVALHGGSVEVQSAEGAGSTFTIVLPAAEAGAAEVADRA